MKQRKVGNKGAVGRTDLQLSVKAQPGHICEEAAPHTDVHSYQNTTAKARLSLLFLPFTDFFALSFFSLLYPKQTHSAQAAALTQQVRLGFTATQVFKAPPDEV